MGTAPTRNVCRETYTSVHGCKEGCSSAGSICKLLDNLDRTAELDIFLKYTHTLYIYIYIYIYIYYICVCVCVCVFLKELTISLKDRIRSISVNGARYIQVWPILNTRTFHVFTTIFATPNPAIVTIHCLPTRTSNRTRDLSACSIVPQPTTRSRAPSHVQYSLATVASKIILIEVKVWGFVCESVILTLKFGGKCLKFSYARWILSTYSELFILECSRVKSISRNVIIPRALHGSIKGHWPQDNSEHARCMDVAAVTKHATAVCLSCRAMEC
jgi:hypothetical protein